MSLRPLSDWVLVDLDPVPGENASPGGIILPHPALIRTGVAKRVGPGRLYADGVYKRTDLRVGERVVFLAAVLDTKQGHQLAGMLGENEALVRESDVLFVDEEGTLKVEK